jgi:hypothetical protein
VDFREFRIGEGSPEEVRRLLLPPLNARGDAPERQN